MKTINNFITERLKVSARAADEIPFEDLTFALYDYCNKKHVDHFELRVLPSLDKLSVYDYPYFEKPMITKSGKEVKDIQGYIEELTVESDHKTGELTLIVFYLRSMFDNSPSICRIERDRYDCITNYVKPEVLKEIYDYLIKHA